MRTALVWLGPGLIALCACTAGQTPQATQDAIRVRSLELVDEHGTVRMRASCNSQGVFLDMNDHRGKQAIGLMVRDSIPGDRPMITVFDPSGKATVTFGYPVFMLDGAPDTVWSNQRPTLAFLDTDQRVFWHAPPSSGLWDQARYNP